MPYVTSELLLSLSLTLSPSLFHHLEIRFLATGDIVRRRLPVMLAAVFVQVHGGLPLRLGTVVEVASSLRLDKTEIALSISSRSACKLLIMQ